MRSLWTQPFAIINQYTFLFKREGRFEYPPEVLTVRTEHSEAGTPKADILPVGFWASLVNRKFITRLKRTFLDLSEMRKAFSPTHLGWRPPGVSVGKEFPNIVLTNKK